MPTNPYARAVTMFQEKQKDGVPFKSTLPLTVKDVEKVIKEALEEERKEVAEMIRTANTLKPGQNVLKIRSNDDIAQMVLDRAKPPKPEKDCDDCKHCKTMNYSRSICNGCHLQQYWSPK